MEHRDQEFPKKIVESLIDANIGIINMEDTSNNLNNGLIIKSPELFQDLSNYLSTNNAKYFQITNCNVNTLMKYSDGTYSSIVRGLTKIEGKQGFELIDPVKIAYDIYSIVKRHFDSKLIRLYQDAFERQQHDLNLIKSYFDIEISAKLEAFSFFLKEIYQDALKTKKNEKYTQATLGNIQRNRIELNIIFNTICSHIKLNIASNQIDYKKLFTDYSQLKTTSTFLIISLILEYLLADRIDDEGIVSLNDKIKMISDMQVEAIKSIQGLVTNRVEEKNMTKNNVNQRWKFTFQQLLYDNELQLNLGIEVNELQKLVNQLSDDSDDVYSLNEFTELRKKLLSNIVIKKEVNEEIPK